MRRITVLVIADASGVAVGSILPLPGRTKVATPLGNGAWTSAAATPTARPPAVPECAGDANTTEIDTTGPGLSFVQFKAHDFIVTTLGPCSRIEGRADQKEV